MTHGPPYGILDEVSRPPEVRVPEIGRRTTERAGCGELRKAVARVRPHVHVFGHIHSARGIRTEDGAVFVNASVSDDVGCVRGHAAVVDLKLDRDPGFKNAYPMCHYAWIPSEEKA